MPILAAYSTFPLQTEWPAMAVRGPRLHRYLTNYLIFHTTIGRVGMYLFTYVGGLGAPADIWPPSLSPN